MYYHFKIHNDADGMWAECIEMPGCQTQADSEGQLRNLMKEVLDLYLEEPEDSKIIFPLPLDLPEKKDVVKVKVEPRIAFANYLRILRKQHHFTQKKTAELMGFKHLYSYQRLESSKKANPELKTLEKIKEVFPEFDMSWVI